MVTERVVSVFAEARTEGGWVVQSPDHGCFAQADTIGAALVLLREALRQTIGPCQVQLRSWSDNLVRR